MKKNVLVLTSTFPRWKNDHLPPFVFELTRRLGEKHNIHVLAPHCPGCERKEIMANVIVHRYRYAPDKLELLAYGGGISTNLRKHPLRSLLIIPFLLSQFFSALRLARQEHIELIHAHWIIPQGLVAVAVSKLVKTHPVTLITAHGADVYTRNNKLISSIKRFVLSKCDRVTVVSKGMATVVTELLNGHEPDVIPMGADLEKCFYPCNDQRSAQRLVTAGRLVEKKGTIFLIDAFAQLRKRYPELTLIVAGDGPERASILARARSLQVEDKVIFTGSITHQQLAHHLQQSSIAVFPFIEALDGDQEGFGLVVIEAMGCGCATIVSALPAIRDIIIHDNNGLLIEQKNPDAIVSSVSRLLDQAGVREKLASTGRTYVMERFDWSIITRKYADIYRELVKS